SPVSPGRNTFVARLTEDALCATCCTLGGVPVRVAGALSAGCGLMRAVTGRRMLLDTASLHFRACFGVPDALRAPDVTPVNAVRGLLDFIARLVRAHRPDRLVACMDADWRPQWRVDLIPSYKAHRVAEEHETGPDEEEVPDTLSPQ